MPQITKQLIINAIQLVEIDGSTNVPTVLCYTSQGAPLVGYAAQEAGERRHLNEDFKLALGEQRPGVATTTKRFRTALGTPKSAGELTADFIRIVLEGTKEWLEAYGIEKTATVMVAEPLTMQSPEVSQNWLVNYRSLLTRIFKGQGFSEVEFLPEPFAVFQYYRYGIRVHPVSERGKHVALVVDFGGGTLDVCVVETTKEGDISQSGRNSKPLGAASSPHAGFFVNRVIAEHLCRKQSSPKDRQKIANGLGVYRSVNGGRQSLETISEEYRSFVTNFEELVHRVEIPKITLCKDIDDWRLDRDTERTVPVSISKDMFSSSSAIVDAKLTGPEFRQLFLEKVWKPHVKPTILQCVQRAKAELDGQPISVVLLSGGSANIGWMRELIETEFATQLQGAGVVPLPDFQEVVAKGLAVECARRFFTESGDFSNGVTYNRLCLVLNADDTGNVLRPFEPRTPGMPPAPNVPGVLLPSASVLRHFLGKDMLWKFRLDHPPRRSLQYNFLRSSFDPHDITSLQNVEERTVQTPKECHFDRNLQLTLRAEEDGTIRPKFTYHQGRDTAECVAVSGRPFFLDMTQMAGSRTAAAYLGFDFGTSNSSVSFIDERRVNTYQVRQAEAGFRRLSELVGDLPSVVAGPLSRYLAEAEPERMAKKALECIETLLAFAAYSCYVDYCAHKGRGVSRLFKGFTQRSGGPLWALLRETLGQTSTDGWISPAYSELLKGESVRLVDHALGQLVEYKHDKTTGEIVNPLKALELLANVTSQALRSKRFGFFQDVKLERFGRGYRGLFRIAVGNEPYTEALTYTGQEAHSETDAFIIDLRSHTGIALHPLLFWDRCAQHKDLDWGHCYLFDRRTKEGADYKAAGYGCVLQATAANEYGPLLEKLNAMAEVDSSSEVLAMGAFTTRDPA